MQIRAEASSPWMTELEKQLVRGKQVLLYGNVADLFLLNGEYITLPSFLERYFREEHYEIVGRYDLVDGLRFADGAMRELFMQALRQAHGGEAEGPAAALGQVPPPAASPPAGPAGAPTPAGRQRTPARAGPLARAGPFLPQLDQAFDAIRTALTQAETSTAVVIDFADKVVTDPQRQTENELKLMVLLKKMTLQAAYLTKDPLKGRKNALVIVAGQLGTLPPWLYHENPLIALVQVSRPRLEERSNFVRKYVRAFGGGTGLTPAETAETIRLFSDLTDGLTAWDLEAIRLTSIVEKGMPIAKPRVLVDYYKYGQRDDPWERLDVAKIRDARQQIERRVIGQPTAIEAIVNMLVTARVGVSLTEMKTGAGRPKGVFFFVGPTGVGKTEMAKALTELIFGDDAAFARFDMSEYAEQHAAEKLTGSPPGYVGFEEGGQLTNRLRERPFSLLLFDEIEKAHGRVMDKFLQILEDGRLTDGKGQTAYFSQSVIIFTSNIGSDSLDLHGVAGGQTTLSFEEVREHYFDKVREHFTQRLGRPELLNRLGDNILVFDLLRPQYIDGICEKFLKTLTESAREKYQLQVVLPDGSVLEMIRRLMLEGENLLFGGRRIKTLLEALVERPLNRWLFFQQPPRGARVAISAAPGGTELRIETTP